jgi:hypothetical protein
VLALRFLGLVARGVLLVAVGLVVLLWAFTATAQPAERFLVLEVLPGAPEIDADALRQRVADEVGMRVVAPRGSTASPPEGLLLVGVLRETGELAVEYRRAGHEALTRRVPLPADPSILERTVVFLAGNMVRDESQDLLRGLQRAPAVQPAPPARPPRDDGPLAPPPTELRRFWLGLGVEGAMTSVPGTDNACGPSSGFYCVMSGGQDYAPGTGTPGLGASIAPGLAFASSRLTVSFDYALSDNWLLGARVGIVLHRYPGTAAVDAGKTLGPQHLEARATYVLGERALARPGARVAVTLGAGAAEWDTSTPVTTYTGAPTAPQTLDAWHVQSGPFFSVGLGPRIAVGEQVALVLDVAKVTALAGATSATGFSLLFTPDVGVEVGF